MSEVTFENTAAHARELAQNLRELGDRVSARSLDRFIDDNIDHIAATLDALASECEQQATTIRHNAEDWADDDTRIREACKLVLPAKEVEGDSYYVPSMADLCEMMAKKAVALATQCEQLRKALHEMCLSAGDLRVAEMRHDLIREKTTANVLRATQAVLDAEIGVARGVLGSADAMQTDS